MTTTPLPSRPGEHVLIVGAGATGASVARTLDLLGIAHITADRRFHDQETGPGYLDPKTWLARPDTWKDVTLVVTSPGIATDDAVLTSAAEAGVPVMGDVEFAWYLDQREVFGPARTWVAITGTNGKTTTTAMVETILRADGGDSRAIACANYGLPILDALTDPARYEVLVAELSSFQLHYAPSLRPAVGVVLNIAEDHLDWHGSLDSYARAKAQVLTGDVAVVNLDEPTSVAPGGQPPTATLLRPYRLGHPATGEVGVIDGQVVIPDGDGFEQVLPVAAIRPAGAPGLADALAAVTMTRALGTPPSAIRAGLESFSPHAHRGEDVAVIHGVRMIDNSKATNPHAAIAACAGLSRFVLVAGGQLKGAQVDELLARCADRLDGVVLLGVDRDYFAAKVREAAPDVPCLTVWSDGPALCVDNRALANTARSIGVTAQVTAADVMAHAVKVAWSLTTPETEAVLLAPAAASLDMFTGYTARGDAFAAAARDLAVSAPWTRTTV